MYCSASAHRAANTPPSNLGGPIGAPSGLGAPGMRVTAPPATSPWTIWGDVRGTGIRDRDDAAAAFRGDQVNATFGIGGRIGADTAVGLLGGQEAFDYHADAIDGRLKGEGTTIGVFFGRRFGPRLLLDAVTAYSRLEYDSTSGLASGSFDADRWLFSGGLTARMELAHNLLLEPSARVIVVRESRDAWTDSLSVTHGAEDVTQGRASFGAKLIRTLATPHARLSPFIGLYGDYYFSSDASLPTGLEGLGLSDGWSLRGVAGVAASFESGVTLSVSGDVGGVGSDYLMRSLRASVALPF